MARLIYTITAHDAGHELGDVLHHAAGMSRRGITHAKYREDGLLLDGVRVRTNTIVSAGQVASIALDDAADARAGCSVAAEAGISARSAVEGLFEDESLVVVDKPAGMVMYPGPGHAGDTLGNVVLANLAAAGRPSTLHPVHRLDGGTSGVVVFAGNAHVQHALQQALHTEDFVREYIALCEGVPGASDAPAIGDVGTLTCEDGEFVVDAPIARISYSPNVFAAVAPDDARGKHARTRFSVEESFEAETPAGSCRVSRLRLRLETGRTHQIRIHLALIGHPLLGDATYGAGPFAYLDATGAACTLVRPALHSSSVTFTHPLTHERLHIACSLPEDLATLATLAAAVTL